MAPSTDFVTPQATFTVEKTAKNAVLINGKNGDAQIIYTEKPMKPVVAVGGPLLPLSDAVTVTTDTSFPLPIDYDAFKRRRPMGVRLDGTKEDISLRKNLWSHFDPVPFLSQKFSEAEIQAQSSLIRQMVKELPRDPYARKGDGRYRAYARAHLLLYGDKPVLRFVDGHPDRDGDLKLGYYQADFNPDYSDDAVRSMPALPTWITSLPLLHELLIHDAKLADWNLHDFNNPIHIGIHFIKCEPSDDFPEAVSSPNALHQDGEIFSFVHLLERTNVDGGANAVALPQWVGKLPEDIPKEFLLDDFTMTSFLEGWGVHDALVSHHAGSVRRLDPTKPCSRAVMVVDMQPMRSVYTRHEISAKMAEAQRLEATLRGN